MERPSRPSSIDADLLGTLERAFAEHAGADGVIDFADLKRALGLRSDALVRRVLAAFDLDADGLIQKSEFLACVRRLVTGGPRDKLWFAFRAHDADGDGYLSLTEVEWMIAIALAESEVVHKATQPPERLANALFLKADHDRDGKISFEELFATLRSRPQLLEQMVRNEAAWIAPNEELLVYLDRVRGRRRLIAAGRGALENNRRAAVVVALWVAANVAVLAAYLFPIARGAEPLVQASRAFSRTLDLNGAIIFLPVMRRLLTKLRPTFFGRLVPVDDAIDFHKLVGHTMFGAALAHTAFVVGAYVEGHPQPAFFHLFTTKLGVTGALLLVVFTTLWVFAIGPVRRRARFELFYFTHLSYVAWLALVIIHGPHYLVWAGGTLVAFVIEQIIRLRRRGMRTAVVSCQALRSGVTRLELKRPRADFRFQAGDYVFLRLPWIAKREWHPFTISSAPESEHLTLHVRTLGNWTHALRAKLQADYERGLAGPWNAFIDGPYGTPSAAIFESRYVVLIGAGIGVTPFASILDSMLARAGGATPSSLVKAHFFWLNRDQYSFEWFAALLREVEERDVRAMIDIHLCMTGGRGGITALGLELARDILHSAGRTDIVTGLRTHTHLGPVDWQEQLTALRDKHAPERVDVFFCGPPGLARKLAPLCRELGMTFHEERF
ncbi:MAG: EF-hand domain-containing protein [Polyangiaceae bacterium]